MSDKQSLHTVLGTLAVTNRKLVLMRGREYFRIEDLWRWVQHDWRLADPRDRAFLSEAIYWTTNDVQGKLLLKGVTPKGDEFVAYVEPGSDIPTHLF